MKSNTKVDKTKTQVYTADQMKQIAMMAAHEAMKAFISNNLASSVNLDKCKVANDILSMEGESSMPSIFREVYSYYDQMGDMQKIQLNGRNKAETDAKFQEFLLDSRKKKRSQTLKEFVNTVYRPSFMVSLSPTTLSNYELYLKLNILPYLGDTPMNEVTVATIQSFYDWMATAESHGRKKNINKRSIERIGGLAARIFKIAQEMGIIPDTPFKMKLIRNNGEQARHHKALPDDEVDRIKREIPLMKDERQRLYMGLLAYTGMRKEEILGLRWDHVHLSDGYGEVRTVVIYPNNKKAVVKDTPKTECSIRSFIIPQALRDILEPSWKTSGFVIHGKSENTPMSVSTAKRTYTNAFSILGIKGLYDNHDWRATYGTQCKEGGMTSAQVADLLGHADTRMVETVYARTRHDGIMKQREAIETLNSNYAVAPPLHQKQPSNP